MFCLGFSVRDLGFMESIFPKFDYRVVKGSPFQLLRGCGIRR